MEKEMVNINANLVKEPKFTSFEREGEEVEVVNFMLVKKYGKGKEYINCSTYEDKAKIPEGFQKGDFVKLFGKLRTSINEQDKEHINVRILDSKLLKSKERGRVKKKRKSLF